jgi:nucleoside-diphosphate-sugar epimerase
VWKKNGKKFSMAWKNRPRVFHGVEKSFPPCGKIPMSPPAGPTMVVTGAAGFIGRRVVAGLAAAGARMVAVDRAPAPAGLPAGVAYRCGDVAEILPQLPGGVLVHLAWSLNRADARAQSAAAADFMQLLAGGDWGGVVGMGSAEEYGEREGCLEEAQAPGTCLSAYGAAKHVACGALRDWSGRAGRPAYWLRPFVVYGPGQGGDMAIPYAMRCAREQRPAELSAGLQFRDFIHVADVAAGIVQAALRAGSGGSQVLPFATWAGGSRCACGRFWSGSRTIWMHTSCSGSGRGRCAQTSRRNRWRPSKPRRAPSHGARRFRGSRASMRCARSRERTTMPERKVMVLGAGLAGLGFARHWPGARVFEAESEPGGHARSHEFAGAWFDRGAHICHSQDKAWLELVCAHTPMHEMTKSVVLNHKAGRWFAYPVQNHLADLPAAERDAALADFLAAQEKFRGQTPRNYESGAGSSTAISCWRISTGSTRRSTGTCRWRNWRRTGWAAACCRRRWRTSLRGRRGTRRRSRRSSAGSGIRGAADFLRCCGTWRTAWTCT